MGRSNAGRDMDARLAAVEEGLKVFSVAVADFMRAVAAERGGNGAEELMTCVEVGAVLRCSACHVRNLYHAGVLKGRRHSSRGIRVYRSSLEAAMKGGQV